jgi:hypothetical protein
MKKAYVAIALSLGLFLGMSALTPRPQAQEKSEKQVGHMVFFALKDNSKGEKQKLVDACKKYLTKHPGEVYFSAGVLAEDLKREVNVVDWDVALHLVFKDKAAHDQYQTAPRHEEFIKEMKYNWKNVRVFDSYVD